jgi:hypothetical protein
LQPQGFDLAPLEPAPQVDESTRPEDGERGGGPD